jgi:predicted GNAT family acetyltransferase
VVAKVKRSVTDRLRDAARRARDLGLPVFLFYSIRPFLTKAGIGLTPFYWIKESTATGAPPDSRPVPEGFEVSIFGPEEVALIASHPERAKYVPPGYVSDSLRHGDTCVGIKRQGEIVASTWFSLEGNRSQAYRVKLQPHEAYLYDTYVFEAYRGRHLAEILRYRTYDILRTLNRTVLYTLTVCSNTASLRFKQRLGARAVFLGLAVELFGRYHTTFVLKRWPETPQDECPRNSPTAAPTDR